MTSLLTSTEINNLELFVMFLVMWEAYSPSTSGLPYFSRFQINFLLSIVDKYYNRLVSGILFFIQSWYHVILNYFTNIFCFEVRISLYCWCFYPGYYYFRNAAFGVDTLQSLCTRVICFPVRITLINGINKELRLNRPSEFLMRTYFVANK